VADTVIERFLNSFGFHTSQSSIFRSLHLPVFSLQGAFTVTVDRTQLSLPGFRLELHDSPPVATVLSRHESSIAPHKQRGQLSCVIAFPIGSRKVAVAIKCACEHTVFLLCLDSLSAAVCITQLSLDPLLTNMMSGLFPGIALFVMTSLSQYASQFCMFLQ
jgi:hypothetical protein